MQTPAQKPASVADLLADARRLGVARLDAQLLLSHHLNRSRSWLLAHTDALLEPQATAWVRSGLARRATGEPLAYVLGCTSFCGLALSVSPAVLVPRPETELLVRWALEVLEARRLQWTRRAPDGPAVATGQPFAAAVADLGTGSGAIALALLAAPGSLATTVCATDASAEALAVAAINAQALGLPLELLLGDWWAPLAGRRFDLVVSNPPYIASGDPHLAALTHEPATALTPGGDGLQALHHLIAGASDHLLQGGCLLLEHGHDQAEAVRSAMASAGFGLIETRTDLAGLPRCSRGVIVPLVGTG